MIKPEFLQMVTKYVRDKVSFAKYKIGDQYYRADVTTRIYGNAANASFEMRNQTGAENDVVSEVQLYDRNGNVIAERAENIQIRVGGHGMFYEFVFTVTEGIKELV